MAATSTARNEACMLNRSSSSNIEFVSTQPGTSCLKDGGPGNHRQHKVVSRSDIEDTVLEQLVVLLLKTDCKIQIISEIHVIQL